MRRRNWLLAPIRLENSTEREIAAAVRLTVHVVRRPELPGLCHRFHYGVVLRYPRVFAADRPQEPTADHHLLVGFDEWRLVIYGIFLIVIITVFPGGLAGGVLRLREWAAAQRAKFGQRTSQA